jgi:tRNA pseudouridine55 synthase
MAGLAKCYTTEIVLGVSTTTLDDSGERTGTWDMSEVSLDQVRSAAKTLSGTILQVPPMVSALKVGGRRLYELAREGIEVERAARPVTVERFDVSFSLRGDYGPVLKAEICCSTGTYIRVLAEDLGRLLGGGAHVRNLRRSSVGPWDLSVAVPLGAVDVASVISMSDALPWMGMTRVEADVERKVRNGRALSAEELGVTSRGPWRVLGSDGSLLAVYGADGPLKVVPEVVMGAVG